MAIRQYEPEEYLSILLHSYGSRLHARTLLVLEERLRDAQSARQAHKILSVSEHISNDLRYRDLQGSIEHYLRQLETSAKIPLFYSQEHPTINHALLYLQTEAGLSASKLARLSGVNLESIRTLKEGRRLHLSTIERLLSVFEISPANAYRDLLKLPSGRSLIKELA